MRDKYANKSPAGKIFHRYTGFIVFGIFISLVAFTWWYFTADDVYFESWNCGSLTTLDPETLTPEERERWYEIFETSCKTFVYQKP